MASRRSATILFLLLVLLSSSWACIPTVSPDEDDYDFEETMTSIMMQTMMMDSTSTSAMTSSSSTTSSTSTTTTTTTTPTTTTTTDLNCPANWVYNPDNGHCYYFSTTTAQGNSAEAECNTLATPSYLVSIADPAEQMFVHTLAFMISPASYFWIGATAPAGSSTFTWTDSSSFGYTNWNGGEPRPSTTAMRCTFFITSRFPGVWQDTTDCMGQNSYYICKY